MSSNAPDDNTKPAKDHSQAAEFVQTSTDLWSLYLKEANERAMAKVDLWKGSLKAFLLFAGLFAAVVSPFVIDSQAKLQPTSPATKVPFFTLAINFLWFSSLTFTLISALAAVLAQTWIVKFSLVPTQGFKGAMERWIRDDGAERWRLHTAIAWITVLIQLSLFLFLAGFAVQAVADHKSLGWTILSFVLATLVLYIGITVLPWFYPTTPFGTPISELSRRNQSMLLSEALGLAPTTKAKSRGVRKFMQSIWTNLWKKPDEAEVRLGVCWSILKNSSNNLCIHAAVLELTKQQINPRQSRRLMELGFPEELSFRLANLPAGYQKAVAVVERMKDYLHVIMWMVDECDSDAARGFSLLIKSDGALLLALDALPTACRALAFAIRVNLLVNVSEQQHGRIHATDWAAMIDGLESYVALDVFRAAIRGLGIANLDSDRVKGQQSSHLRQDCARMLGAYIGSARFSNEDLVKTRIADDTLRIARARTRQESSGQITMFWFQLEEAWKRTMCTRAIRMMEEVRMDRQILGFQMLSFVAGNETFRQAMNDVLPELGNALMKVDWKTSVDCLGRLAEIVKQDSRGTFRKAIERIFPKIIVLLSDSKDEVRRAVFDLSGQIDIAGVATEIDRILDGLMKDIQSDDWRSRVSGLHSLAGLVKMGPDVFHTADPHLIEHTDKIRPAIIKQASNILACIVFPDEDVRISAIRTLQELGKHNAGIIEDNMSDILGLVSDEDSSVREAAIEFVSELAGNASFKPAMNRNIPGFVTDNFSSEEWFVRRAKLHALGKIITSEQQYERAVHFAFTHMVDWLSDRDGDVRRAALQVVSLAAGKEGGEFSADIEKVLPNILEMLQVDSENGVRVDALNTFSQIAKIQRVPIEGGKSPDERIPRAAHHSVTFSESLTKAIPIVAELFKDETIAVRVAAFETCSGIAKIQKAAVRKEVDSTMAQILQALDHSEWRTRIAALKVISTLAETEGLCGALNDNALETVFAGLSDEDPDVRFQVLDTLTVLATKEQLHNKINTTIRDMLPLLEDWWSAVRRKALDTLAVFAKHGIFSASDDEIVSRVISALSEDDTDTSTRVLDILSIAATQGDPEVTDLDPKIFVVTNSLSHQKWRVRVAGLRVLESLADDTKYRKISFPAQDTIVKYLSDPAEKVRLAVLHTLFEFIDKDVFGNRLTVPDSVPTVISSLLQSGSEEIRTSAMKIVSDYKSKAEFHPAISDVIPAIVKLLDSSDEDIRVAMLETVCRLADPGKFSAKYNLVNEVIDRLPSLLSDHQVAVRTAALRIIPILSQQEAFNKILSDSLPILWKATLRSNFEGNAEEIDVFRIEVLKTLFDLVKNETFRSKMEEIWSSGTYKSAAKEGSGPENSWPTRVAFLKLVSVLDPSGRDSLKTTVKQMMPDISDALRDSENSQVRMAVVQLLSMSAIKEISPSEFKSLLPTLVTLLSDSEEEVRITALQALSDLAKQDAFREAITRTLPPLLEASRRNEAKIRLAALRTCATLAQDITFRHIVNRAIPEILACVEDADDDVQNETMDTLSKLSRYDAFRLVVYEAAPHVISQLDIGGWEIRLLVLRTLSIFAQNDAFSEIISSVSPRIVECMKDKDYDVRVEALRNLLDLVQRSLYKDSIRDALQACGLATLVKLTSDDFVIVRMAVLSLIPKVIELGTFPGAAKMVMSALLKLLSDDDDDDDDECIVALEAIRALIEQDREGAYAKELTPGIPDLYKLLKPDLKTKVSTSLLLTLSAVVTRDEESVETVMNIISRLLLVIKDIHLEEPQFWAATAKVFLAIASLGGEPVGNVHTFLTLGVTSALSDSSRYARILGLMVMESIGQEIPEFKFDDCRPLVLKLLESEDFDIRLPAIRVADLFKFAVPGPREEGELHTAILNTWLQTVEHLKSPNPTAGVFEKMCKFAPYVDVFGSIHTIPAIVAALRGQYAIPVLRAISELAHSELGDALVPVVPKITAMLTSKNSDTQIRLEVLENLLRFADHGKLRIKIQEHVYAIIPFLKDRESKVRVAGLQVLLKLVQPVPPENLPDRIKLTLPTLLTLIQNSTTREDSVALITCLAGDKTLRSELLATLLPIILSTTETPTSWGQMVLIARLLEHRRLNLEESDLRFILCLITSKNTEVQDFMLKFMTKTLQQYLETWRNADKFPSGFASAFSSLAMLKR